MALPAAQPDPALVAKAAWDAMVPALDVLTIALQNSPWLAGDDFSVADRNIASADRMAEAERRPARLPGRCPVRLGMSASAAPDLPGLGRPVAWLLPQTLGRAVDFSEGGWWARQGSNLWPLPCQGSALPLSYAPIQSGSRLLTCSGGGLQASA